MKDMAQFEQFITYVRGVFVHISSHPFACLAHFGHLLLTNLDRNATANGRKFRRNVRPFDAALSRRP